jgi:hypothetical protein
VHGIKPWGAARRARWAGGVKCVAEAIEACAIAAKMARHPAMSRTWLHAGTSDQAMEAFRDKFKKLFPSDDKELSFLYAIYDDASKAMHGSIYACAHYMLETRRVAAVPTSDVFDILNDVVLIAHFIKAIDSHLTMLFIFERILKDSVPNIQPWSANLLKARDEFSKQYFKWRPLVLTGCS